MALDLIEELERVVAAFDGAGIDYALCGGLAFAIHAHPRATHDIDVLVRREDLARAVDVARQVGFDAPAQTLIFGLSKGAPREVQRISKRPPESNALLSLDFLLVGNDLEPVWATRMRLPWLDRTISIVSREGLVTTKQLAGRRQDVLDIDVLEGRTEDEVEPLDISGRAITGRLATTGALYKLMLSFREIRMDQARPINPQPATPPSTKR